MNYQKKLINRNACNNLEKNEKELYTGMVNPVKSFDSVQQQAEQIIQSLDNPNVKEKAKSRKVFWQYL